MIKKPMLASAIENIETIKYPILASPKLDGIRALVVNGKLVSRSFKPIPNKYICKLIESILPDGVDGELIVGKTFQQSSSGVMYKDGEPDFEYYLFDFVSNVHESFLNRFNNLKKLLVNKLNDYTKIKLVDHVVINYKEELLEYEVKVLAQGYEGVMVRSLNGPYKEGRSSVKEGYLLKLKRFEDSEAIIEGFEELMHNHNEAQEDNFGRTKRLSAAEGLASSGILVSLCVRDIKTGIDFKIGSGFDEAQRKSIWNNKADLTGKIVKYRFQPTGVLEKPRFPTLLGIRHQDDLG